jgi:hypothetical protein
VSTDKYTQLEQGRHLSPSESVLDAIGTVRRLDAASRQHLADLARALRARPRHSECQQVRPEVLRLLETLDDHAAFVLQYATFSQPVSRSTKHHRQLSPGSAERITGCPVSS